MKIRAVLAAVTVLISPFLADAYEIKGPPAPTPAEKTAMADLQKYLSKTASSLQVGGTDKVTFYVGNTDFARRNGIDVVKLPSEQWLIKNIGGDVILAGGGSRGTLYAVYSFLENQIGVHWWNEKEESVPEARPLSFASLDLQGKPFFDMRDIYRMGLENREGGTLAIRNRANRDGDKPVPAAYGGSYNYGLPYHVHTMSLYVPAGKYLQEKPEFFALKDGKRVKEQLCPSNPELRKFLLAKLKEYVAKDRRKAAEQGIPAPVIYDFSMNDSWTQCQCDTCKKISAEDNPSGLHLRLINYLADEIRKDYPDIYMEMLAYYYLEETPKITHPHDNVIIRLCNTRSDQNSTPDSPRNTLYNKLVTDWSKICNHLYIWEYGGMWNDAHGLPLPSEYRLADSFKFYADNHVEGIFFECEELIYGEMPEYKNWLAFKFMENPHADFKSLQKTFLDGYYGKAGASLLHYRDCLAQASAQKQYSVIAYDSGPGTAFDYLDEETIKACMNDCDEAEKAVAGDPVLLNRVRLARLPLDRYLAAFYGYKFIGKIPPATFKAAADRLESMDLKIREYWLEHGERDKKRQTIHPRIVRYLDFHLNKDKMRRAVIADLEKKGYQPPEPFAGKQFIDLLPTTFSMAGKNASIVPDPETANGYAGKIAIDGSPYAAWPCPVNFHGWRKIGSGAGMAINGKNLAGTGYHWYKFGPVKITDYGYLYFTRSWELQVAMGPLSTAFAQPEVNVNVRMKFEGKDYQPSQQDKPSAVYVERIVITPGSR